MTRKYNTGSVYRPRKAAANPQLHHHRTFTTASPSMTTMIATTVCFIMMLLIPITILQHAHAVPSYTCTPGGTDTGVVTMDAGSHSIDGCTLSNKVIINTDAVAIIKNTIFEYAGVQLQINDNVDVSITGSTFKDTGGDYSVSIITFGSSAKITIDGNAFEGRGFIYLPSSPTTLSADTVLRIINNNLQLGNRGGGNVVTDFVKSDDTIVIQEGGELEISGNVATDSSGAVTFDTDGGFRILSVKVLDVQSTSSGTLSVTKNLGFEMLVYIQDGTFTASSAGKIMLSDNVQKCKNCRNVKSRISRIFQLNGILVPVGFSIFMERNTFEVRLPLYSGALTGGDSVYLLDVETNLGFKGYLGIRHNAIYYEHCDTSQAMTPFYLKLNDGSPTMTGTLEVSDNIATLHTPTSTGINFMTVVSLRCTNAQVWVLRNTVTYTNQLKNYLVIMDHKQILEKSRIVISRNVVWGGVTNEDSQLFFHAGPSVTPIVADPVLEITHNYIDCWKDVMKIDDPHAYARIIFSYNVVNPSDYQLDNSVNKFSGLNVVEAELCHNRYSGVYFANTKYSDFVGSGALLPCPKRTLTESISLPTTATHSSNTTVSISTSIPLIPTQSRSNTDTIPLVPTRTRSNTTSLPDINITTITTTSSTTTTTTTTGAPTTTTITTKAPEGRIEGQNVTETDVTVVVPKDIPDEVFAGGVAIGSVSAPIALLETASSIQMAAIFTVMPCRTMDGSRSIMSHVLSPLQLSGTNASDVLGSLVLLVTISVVYFAVTLPVLRLARRFGNQEGDAPEMRVFKVKLYTWYPRVPMTIAVLLLPGMSFESCSLLYGVKNGGPWWERVIGAVGLLISLVIVAYHIAVGVVVGRCARKETQTDAVPSIEGAYETEQKDGVVHDVKTSHDETVADTVIVFNDEDEDNVDGPRGDGCEIPDREAMNDTTTPKDSAPPPLSKAEDTKVSVDADTPKDTSAVSEEMGVTSLDGPQSDIFFVTYTEEAKARVPAVLRTPLLATGRWNKHVLRSMRFVVVNNRRDVVSYVCAHNCARILLVSIVAAVDGKNVLECHVVQGIIAAICFVHALLILLARIYRVPILTPLQAGQSVCVGLLACAAFIQNAAAQNAFIIIMMVLSLITTILCGVVALLEVRVNQKVSSSPPADLDNPDVQK